jgi:diguanylate cyclase (GGDEF)-like protein
MALPDFDPRTLVFVSSLLALLCSTILFLQRRSFPSDVGGLGYWSAGCMAAVFASLLFGLRGLAPELFTIVIPNTLLVGGFMLIYVGILDYYEQRANLALLGAILIGVALLSAWFTFAQPDYRLRVLMVTAIDSIILLMSGRRILMQRPRNISAAFTGIAFLATALISATRFVATLTNVDVSSHLLDTSPLQKLYIASFAFSILILTVGLMMMANDRLRATLEYIAAHDALSGAFSRGTFLDLLAKELARSQRHRRPLALMMLDLDDFKAINDAHGHLMGDRVIVDFATRASALLRQDDFLGRYGGEEFVALLPETTLEEACAIANRICNCIATAEGSGLPAYTVSIGVAAAHDGNMLTESLLSLADRELYLAKRNGRNRVEPCLQSPPALWDQTNPGAAHRA